MKHECEVPLPTSSNVLKYLESMYITKYVQESGRPHRDREYFKGTTLLTMFENT